MTQLASNKLKQAEFQRNEFRIEPEAGTPFSKVLEEKYWAHVSVQLKRGDVIEVLAEDDSYFGEVIVLDAGKLYAKVQQLRHVEFYSELSDAKLKQGEYSIQWKGKEKRWVGMCGSDILVDKMTKDAAVSWLEQRTKKVA